MTCQTKNVNAATAVHVNVKAVAKLQRHNDQYFIQKAV